MNEIIVRYLNGEATLEEKQQVLAWLRKDRENKKIFSEIRDIWIASISSAISDEEVCDAFAYFEQRIDRHERKGIKHTRYSLWHIAAAAAILLLCSLSGYFFGKQSAFTGTTENMFVMNQVIMGDESKGNITLPDGTKVWLNANSKISYPEMFLQDVRKVKLEGEAYFDVIHNAQSPFIVESDRMEVNVLGTQFDTKNYATQSYSETTLLTGKVEVRFSSDSEFILLEPNHTISFDKQKNTFSIHEVKAKDYIIWTNDKLTFTNELLSDILYKMEKWYNIRITCADGVPLDQRLSFTIRREPKEEIFKLLELIAPIKSNVEGYNVFIRKK
ncbi:MAG: FecR domain-containing protein [Tannerella sp.]|nr:FecR domain-containing protein [Tannerella sp.]